MASLSNTEEDAEEIRDVDHFESSAFATLYRPVVQRQFWLSDGSSSLHHVEEERPATSNDLVLDLIYVVLLSKLGGIFRSNLMLTGSWRAFRDFFAMYLPIWSSWSTTMTYFNVFDAEDFVHFVFFALSMLSMAFVGLSMESCGAKTRSMCANWAFAVTGARVLLVVQILYALLHMSPSQRKPIIVHSLCAPLLSAVLWLAVAVVNFRRESADEDIETPGLQVLYWTTVVSDYSFFAFRTLAARRTTFKRFEQIPLNLKYFVERHELFIVLSLGELAVASVAYTGGASSEHGGETHSASFAYKASALVVCLACLLKALYFDLEDHVCPSSCQGNEKRTGTHALSTSPRRGMVWTFLHLPTNACLVILGSSLECLVSIGTFSLQQAWFAAGSIGVFSLTTTLRQLAHRGAQRRRVKKEWRTLMRVALAVLASTVPAFGFDVAWSTTEPKEERVDNPAALHLVATECLIVFLMALSDGWMRHVVAEAGTRHDEGSKEAIFVFDSSTGERILKTPLLVDGEGHE